MHLHKRLPFYSNFNNRKQYVDGSIDGLMEMWLVAVGSNDKGIVGKVSMVIPEFFD